LSSSVFLSQSCHPTASQKKKERRKTKQMGKRAAVTLNNKQHSVSAQGKEEREKRK